MHFDHVESEEATKTSYLLLENEFRLYQGVDLSEDMEDDGVKDEEEDDPYGMNRQYYAEGYEANVHQADDKELSEWRNLFNCMHVVGEGLVEPPVVPSPLNHVSIQQSKVVNTLKDIESSVWKEIVLDLSGFVEHVLDIADRHNIPTDLKALDKPPPQAEYVDDFW